MKKIIIFSIILLPSLTFGQQDYGNDVKSVDAIVAALYDVISGDADAARDWNRFKNLFTSDARLIPTGKNPDGKFNYRIITPDEYVQLFTTKVTTGFFERELHRTTETYGSIVHAFSTYETKELKGGNPTNRGINSIQLFYDGNRYYVMNIFWCAESLGFNLPEKYTRKQ